MTKGKKDSAIDTEDSHEATLPVTSLMSCPRSFVVAFVAWVTELPHDQYWDQFTHGACVWNHIMGRQCDVEEGQRSGWHSGARSDAAGPLLLTGWTRPAELSVNNETEECPVVEQADRYQDIVASLVLERRVLFPREKRVSVDRTKSKEAAKELGSFYTPAPIVDYLVHKTVGRILAESLTDDHARLRTIVDPACGDGNFLVGAAEYLLAYWWLRLGHEVSTYERQRIVCEQLFGVDLDAEAVAACRVNLAEIAGCTTEEVRNVKCGNSLIGITQTTPEEFAKLGPHPNRDAYDGMLLQQFNDLRIKKENKKWDAGKKKTVTASKQELTLDDIREMKPFHWEYEFPGVFSPGQKRGESSDAKRPDKPATAQDTKKPEQDDARPPAEPRPHIGEKVETGIPIMDSLFSSIFPPPVEPVAPTASGVTPPLPPLT